MATKKVILSSIDEALNLFGQLDVNIKQVESDSGADVFIKHSGGPDGAAPAVFVRGSAPKVKKAVKMIDALRRKYSAMRAQGPGNTDALHKASFDPSIQLTRRGRSSLQSAQSSVHAARVAPRTPQQKKYVELMENNDIVLAIGPAGTGKTYLAVACALAELAKGKISKIVLTRPVVEAGEKLGFLPGDFYDKVNPYLRPLYDAFYTMLGPEKFRMYRDDETIEIVPIAYMRGRTMNGAFVILDEAQNTTPEQMKMFLTRMGENSKIVITGDVTQIDLDNNKRSGLVDAHKILRNISEIKFVRFSEEDVQRHGLVKKIIKAYESGDSGGASREKNVY